MRRTIAITLSIVLWTFSGCEWADSGPQSAEEQFQLGEDLRLGRGVRENHQQAIEWYRKAAEQGHPTAQVRLAMRYDEGRGLKKNRAEALRLYRLAAEKGHPKAQLELGLAYRDGRGMPRDLVQAQAWLMLSALQGSRVARFMSRQLIRQLNEEQLDEARRIAHTWRTAHYTSIAAGSGDAGGG